MIISGFIATAWLVLALLFTSPQKIPRHEFVFLFLFYITINTHAQILISDNLKFISLPKDPALYLAYLLYWIAIIPAILCMFANRFLISHNWLILLVCMCVIAVLEIACRSLQVFSYEKQWNLLASLTYFLLLQLLGVGAVGCFNRMCIDR